MICQFARSLSRSFSVVLTTCSLPLRELIGQRHTFRSLHLGVWTALGFLTTFMASQNAKRSLSGSITSANSTSYNLTAMKCCCHGRSKAKYIGNRLGTTLWQMEGKLAHCNTFYWNGRKTFLVWNVGGTIVLWFVTPVPRRMQSCSVEVLKGRHACFTIKRRISTSEM